MTDIVMIGMVVEVISLTNSVNVSVNGEDGKNIGDIENKDEQRGISKGDNISFRL